MDITAIVVVGFLTYVIAEVRKGFPITDKKMIPLQNLVIGIAAAIIVVAFKIDNLSVLQATILCVTAAMGAGGVYDLKESIKDKL